MIPKKIHYCWFGGNPLPASAKKCIESWKKFCPDYEIIEWNEKNFDIDSCKYARQAYDAKKWAFVSDYARFKILYENGGLYFDTDVEMIKSPAEVVACGNFMGMEKNEESLLAFGIPCGVAPGLGLGAEAGLEVYKEILEHYDSIEFINADGTYNYKTVIYHTTEILLKHGLKAIKEIQCVAGIYIYPEDYFCPLDYASGKLKITPNTISIHRYDGSWLDKKDKFKRFIRSIIGTKLYTKLYKLKHKKK